MLRIPMTGYCLAVSAFLWCMQPLQAKEDWIDVTDYGANGTDNNNDAPAFQAAINAANSVKGTVYIPVGTYHFDGGMIVTSEEPYGSRIEGANAEGVTLITNLAGSDPLFEFRGGSGKFSNVGLKNVTIRNMGINKTATGIKLEGQCFARFENIRLEYLQNGIELVNKSHFNGSQGTFTEGNQFKGIVFNYCNNGILMQQGYSTVASFHGNIFENCFFNIGANQVGFNHQSGYYYNGRFDFHMWSHDSTAVYVLANGNAEHNIGNITYESFCQKVPPGDTVCASPQVQTGRLMGNGRFWFNGYLRGLGSPGITDLTSPTDPWQKVFACNNYWKSEAYGTSGLQAEALPNQTTSYNGPTGFFQALKNSSGIKSVVLNTPSNPGNGLYLGTSGFMAGEDSAVLGMYLRSDGTKIQSYSSNGLQVTVQSQDVLKLDASGKVGIGVPSPAEKLDVNGNVKVAGNKIILGNAQIISGTGTPMMSAPNGSLYLRTDGSGPNLYVRQNNSWISK